MDRNNWTPTHEHVDTGTKYMVYYDSDGDLMASNTIVTIRLTDERMAKLRRIREGEK